MAGCQWPGDLRVSTMDLSKWYENTGCMVYVNQYTARPKNERLCDCVGLSVWYRECGIIFAVWSNRWKYSDQLVGLSPCVGRKIDSFVGPKHTEHSTLYFLVGNYQQFGDCIVPQQSSIRQKRIGTRMDFKDRHSSGARLERTEKFSGFLYTKYLHNISFECRLHWCERFNTSLNGDVLIWRTLSKYQFSNFVACNTVVSSARITKLIP